MYNKKIYIYTVHALAWVCSAAGVGSGGVTAEHKRTCSWRLLCSENTISHLYPRLRWWREHLRLLVKSPNIRGRAQAQLLALSLLGKGGGGGMTMTTINQIHHSWLTKQPQWKANMQTIHFLHHTSNMLPDSKDSNLEPFMALNSASLPQL